MVWLTVKPVNIFFPAIILSAWKASYREYDAFEFLSAMVIGIILEQPIVSDKVSLTFLQLCYFIITTGHSARCKTLWLTLPNKSPLMSLKPRLPIIIIL